MLGLAIIIELQAWRALGEVDALRRILSANIVERDAALDAGLQWLKLVQRHVPDSSDIALALRSALSAAEIQAVLQMRVADTLAAQASTLGQTAATECLAFTAVSPHRSWDSLIVAARSLKLIRQIAHLYGLRPGIMVMVTMIRHVAWTAAGASATAVAAQSAAVWAVDQAPVVKVLAGTLTDVFDGLRILRLAKFAARSCCPMSRQ
jgi:putative membrane protein